MGTAHAGQAVTAGVRVSAWVGQGRQQVRAIDDPPLVGSTHDWTPTQGVLAELAIVEKNGYQGSGVACPRCGQCASYHQDRARDVRGLAGPVRYRRAYYYCRRCGEGFCPFDEAAGISPRHLTPGLERLATLAGACADSFGKADELLHEMAGVRLSESTIGRTTQDAGRELARDLQAGQTLGPGLAWHWYKDPRGRRVAYVGIDATGVRQHGGLTSPQTSTRTMRQQFSKRQGETMTQQETTQVIGVRHVGLSARDPAALA